MDRTSSVSVVIPTRNRGSLLLQAVESALQSAAFEVIVADGGSDDGSIALVEGLDPRVVVVRGDYANAAATRNAGAARASGDYLGFLDSDDVMLPEKVSGLAPLLDDDPSIALAHGQIVVIDDAGQDDPGATAGHRAAFEEAEQAGTSYEALALVCAMFTSATLIRRKAFTDIGGYDETLATYEDWDLYLRLSLAWRLVYARCNAARYRVWNGNVRWDRTAAGVTAVATKHLAALPRELTSEARRDAEYAFLRRIAQSQHILLDSRGARRAAIRALRVSPRRGLADPLVAGLALRTFVPRSVLRRRRPARPGA